MMQGGSTRPVGRTICSTKMPPARSISPRPPVLPRQTRSGSKASPPTFRILSGRLSVQEGSRKPYSANVALAHPVAVEHAEGSGTGDMALVDKAHLRRYQAMVFEKGCGGSPGVGARSDSAANSPRCRRCCRWRRSFRGRRWCAARAAGASSNLPSANSSSRRILRSRLICSIVCNRVGRSRA